MVPKTYGNAHIGMQQIKHETLSIINYMNMQMTALAIKNNS